MFTAKTSARCARERGREIREGSRDEKAAFQTVVEARRWLRDCGGVVLRADGLREGVYLAHEWCDGDDECIGFGFMD